MRTDTLGGSMSASEGKVMRECARVDRNIRFLWPDLGLSIIGPYLKRLVLESGS